MEGKLHDDQPVWKKEEGWTGYIYYSKEYKRWYVDNDLNESAVYLKRKSVDDFLAKKSIHRSGWEYYDGTIWTSDDTSLTISGGY